MFEFRQFNHWDKLSLYFNTPTSCYSWYHCTHARVVRPRGKTKNYDNTITRTVQIFKIMMLECPWVQSVSSTIQR